MRILALAALLALGMTASAAVDGTVTNATTGKPQSGSTVTLFQPTDQGPQFIESVKTGADGKFTITKPVPAGPGPLLLQAVYDGVQYNDMITPGSPTTGVEIPVYESSKEPGGAKITLHAMLIEPNSGALAVSEAYQYQNDGKTTWNNPATGTLQFTLPPAAGGKVEVNVLAPGGLPIRRAADPAGKPNTYKVDFPIKPGQSEIRLQWSMPFTSPGVLQGTVIARGAPPLRIIAPSGVTLAGTGVVALGAEPDVPGSMIYGVDGAAYNITVTGSGTLNPTAADDSDNGSPKVSENMPQLFNLTLADGNFWASLLAVKWLLASVVGMLAVGFALLYRKGNPALTPNAGNESAPDERDRG